MATNYRFPLFKGQVDKWDPPLPKNTIIWYPSLEELAYIILHGNPTPAFRMDYAVLMEYICFQSEAAEALRN